MAKIPQPRRPGQTGGGGRISQTSNRAGSQNRGGSPHRGGGGSGKKPGGGCCSMVAAIRSARRGKFRLAGRYGRMTVRVLAARAVGAF